MPPTRVFISGYYGFDNAGDEAILSVLLRQLRTEFGAIAATVVSGDPPATRTAHSVDTVLWSDPLAIAAGVRAADLVIVGGGGLFHDYGGFLPDSLLTQGNFGLGFHVTAAVLASLFARPLMLYAVGVGPLFSEHGRRYTRAACEAAQSISVRDPASRDLLIGLGIPAERVQVTADPAFSLEPAPLPHADAILTTAGLQRNGPLVGVSVRHWSFGVHPAFWQKEVAAALDLFLDQHGGSVVFVPFQQIEGVQENDLAVAESVLHQMRRRADAIILRGHHPPDHIAAVLGACDVVLGMRLHSLIFSAVAGVPFVALRYDPKVEEIIRHMGAPAPVPLLDLGAITADSIAQALAAAIASGPILDPAGRAHLKQLADSNAPLARHALDQAPVPQSPLLRCLAAEAIVALLNAQDRMQATDTQVRRVLADTERDASLLRDRLNALQWEKEELQSQLAREREDATRQQAARSAEFESTLRDLQASLQRTEARLHDATARFQDAEANLVLRDQQMEALNQAFLQRRDRLAELHQQLDQAAGDRLHAAACSTFSAEFRRRLAIERRQRAWRLMLVVRKAYSLLLREGLAGKLKFPFWALGLLVGRAGDLDRYDLHFPAPPPTRD